MRSSAILIVAAAVRLVHADGGEDAAKADVLFEEANQLKADGKSKEACAKFDEALRYNRNAVGTILNVALCDEQAGKVASATKLFAEARDRAREQNLAEHLKAAEEHLALDEPLVAHVAIAFAEPPGLDTKLVVDDQVVAVTGASDLPLDPGNHAITVTEPGRVPFETTILVAKREHKAVAIPKLGYPVVVKKARRTLGVVVTLSGVGVAVTGLALGLIARHDYNQQIDSGACSSTSPPKCNSDGYSATVSARTLGNVGTGVGIAGIAIALGGAALWYFAPAEPAEHHLVMVPVVSPGQGGIAAVGHF